MPVPVVHFELGCKNLDKAKAFYGTLFGWQFEGFGPSIQMVMNLGAFGTPPTDGIAGHLNTLAPGQGNYCVVYAQVDNLERYVDQAKKLGGSTLVPPTEVPGMGHFAWIKDPEGNVVGLWKQQPS